MKFELTIECDNAAFEENPDLEVSRILRELANKYEYGDTGYHCLRDINGNAVGYAHYVKGV